MLSYYADKQNSPTILYGIVMSVVSGLIFMAVAWLLHIPLNPNILMFWVELLAAIVVVATCTSFFVDTKKGYETGETLFDMFPILGVIPLVIIVIVLIGLFIGSRMISSDAYANRLKVEQSSFAEWSDDLRIEGISLMDTDSATMVGNRELGSLQDVVSQFDDAQYYQVIIGGTPQKVAPLRYVGFFSWLNNRDKGTPGYVLVDPIKQNADYHKLESIEGTGDGLRYIPSAMFGDNLNRLLWMQYPTKVFGVPHFELDDEGHPFYVTQSFGFASFFGAKYVEGVVVTDPTNGKSDYYGVDDVPAWLDVVYDGDLLDEMYDDYGSLSGGFLNSIFAQVGCTRTGGDYGYVMIGDEQWIYTGVTSMGSDSSNVGFLLASEKTGKAYFLPMASADEWSAMQSAEGNVQQYGYEASFPSLVAIDGQPTYVMVLKDNGGLIRLYAMVNAESYNVVACEPNLVACKSSYEDAMRAAGIEFADDNQEMPEVDATGAATPQGTGGQPGNAAEQADDTAGADAKAEEFVTKVAVRQIAEEGGDTYLYVLGEDGNVYRISFADEPKVCMTLGKGDEISGKAVQAGDVWKVTSLTK